MRISSRTDHGSAHQVTLTPDTVSEARILFTFAETLETVLNSGDHVRLARMMTDGSDLELEPFLAELRRPK